MPKYTNSTTRSITIRGGIDNKKHLRIGKHATEDSTFYPLVLPTGITFVSHTPKVNPFIELADVDTFPSAAIPCYGYASLIFYNRSGDVVSLYANDDDTNVLEIPPEVYLTVESDGDWGSVTFVSGGDTGSIKFWGV